MAKEILSQKYNKEKESAGIQVIGQTTEIKHGTCTKDRHKDQCHLVGDPDITT